MVRGKFITLEGSEGVGKTTNVEFVYRYLESAGIDSVQTREPGGTPLAEELREILLAVREETMSAQTELLMMFAARSQHLDQVIEPHLAAGRWVICDRFTDATYAYQGGGRGVDEDQIAALEALVHGDLQPDLTLYLDLAPEIASQRIAQRKADRFELEKRAFFERVRASYLNRAERYKRFAVIDASVTLAEVQNRIAEVLQRLIDSNESES
jgi:dTMP kinase